MAVLTRKEYENSKRSPSKQADEGAKAPDSVSKVSEERVEFVFFYPDNRMSGYHNGVHRMVIDGREIEHDIIDGIIKVQSNKEKEALLNEGWLFLRKQEVKE